MPSQFRNAPTPTAGPACRASPQGCGPCILPPRPSCGGEAFFLPSLDEPPGLLYTTNMTETTSTLITEIETFLSLTAKREMFTSDEIQNLLLDLRLLAEPEHN